MSPAFEGEDEVGAWCRAFPWLILEKRESVVNMLPQELVTEEILPRMMMSYVKTRMPLKITTLYDT